MTYRFRSIDYPDIILYDVVLPETKTHKHLGVTLSSNLSWSSHIDSILNSVAPMADILKKLKYQVDKESLEKIYFSFIRSKSEYGNYIWNNCFEGDKDRLEDFQLSTARTVTGARKRTSHDLIYNELNWPTLADRRKDVTIMKHLNIFVLFFQRRSVCTQSRNQDSYYTVKARTETFRSSFIPSSVKLWNFLDVCDKTLTYVDCLMKKPKPLLFASRFQKK